MSHPNNMTTPLPPSALPYGQLESLRSKITQMIDSIQTLQRTVEGPSGSGYPYMPAWPDILSKYTMLLSQSHNLSMSLVNSYAIRANGGGGGGTGTSGSQNPYERLALHPSVVMSDAQLDNEVIPLLRNQQTTDVLKLENETVRHLAEHMATRGSLGVLGVSSSSSSTTTGSGVRGDVGSGRKVEYADVLSECELIRAEHDERIERAVNAVVRLRNEKYEWKVRVAVEQEEPEDLEWDPRVGLGGGGGHVGNGEGDEQGEGREGREGEEMDVDVDGDVDEGEESNDSEEEEELEEELGNGEDSGEGTPVPEPMVEG